MRLEHCDRFILNQSIIEVFQGEEGDLQVGELQIFIDSLQSQEGELGDREFRAKGFHCRERVVQYYTREENDVAEALCALSLSPVTSPM